MMSELDTLGFVYIDLKKNEEAIRAACGEGPITIGLSSANTVTSLPYSHNDFVVYDKAPWNPISEKYMCPYCGTTFIATEGGFIPECKNCGGTLRLEG